VIVRISDASVRIEKSDDFQQFSVAVAISTIDPAGAMRDAAAGEMDESDAWVATEWIRANSPNSESEEWETQFISMLDYADIRGWLSADRKLIKAHVVTSP
jgi:hypothetical protein